VDIAGHSSLPDEMASALRLVVVRAWTWSAGRTATRVDGVGWGAAAVPADQPSPPVLTVLPPRSSQRRDRLGVLPSQPARRRPSGRSRRSGGRDRPGVQPSQPPREVWRFCRRGHRGVSAMATRSGGGSAVRAAPGEPV